MFEHFDRKLRVEYLSDGIWKQDYFRCTFVEFLQRLNELNAVKAKLDLPHPKTGKWMHYMLLRTPGGKWTVRIGREIIK